MQIAAYNIDSSQLYADESYSLPYDNCPFGQLEMEYGFILTRLNILNKSITQIYELREAEYLSRKGHEYLPREKRLELLTYKMRFSTELKIIVDEMISLEYLLTYYQLNNSWPEKIHIDCIGSFLYSKQEHLSLDSFIEHKDFLNKLNDLANSTKHHFVFFNILWRRNNLREPVIFEFQQKHNDSRSPAEFRFHKLSDVITSFNIILNEFKSNIKRFSENKKSG